MLSKFSVLTKFLKYSTFKQNGLSSIMTRRRCFTKNPTNLLLIPQENNSITAIRAYKGSNFQISRNMGSSNKKGDGQQTESSNKTKILIQKRKKKFLRRRSKVKSLKTSQMKYKSCKSKKQPESSSEKLLTEITLHNNDLQFKKATLKMDNQEVLNNNPGIVQSHIPPKKVHVEFMESQNLKDFNLNKGPSSELIKTNNAIIDIQIKPISSLNDQKSSNVKSIDMDIKNTISNWETQHLTKSNLDYQNKNNLKSEENVLKASKTAMGIKTNFEDEKKLPTENINIEISPQKIESVSKKPNSTSLQVPKTEDTVNTIKNTILPEKDSLHKTISNDNISSPNKSTVFKNSENIRILYQAHPKRKTKIKIPKRLKSNKLSEQYEQDKTKKAVSVDQPKGILFPTEPEPMNSSTLDNKTKPLPNIATNLLKISTTTKNNLDIGKTEIKNEITEDPKTNNQPSPNSKINDSKSITNSTKESTKRSNLHCNNRNAILKTSTNPKLEVSKNPNTSKVTNISGCIHKITLSDYAKEKPKNFLKKSGCPKSMFGEYMAPDKLKDVEATFKSVNTVSKGARPSPKSSNHKNLGSATLKTNKLTKSKRLNRGGNRGGGLGGDGGDKTATNKETTTTKKARPSRFWRTVSLTILPLILGLTVYTISNVGAAEMFKHMRYARSSEDPLSMIILPIFYGKKSKNEQTDLNEIESKENDEEENLNDNENESEKLQDHLRDPRLDEA
ncbi:protein PF3D7_1417600-like isoform X2 [Calliphora vicina]|uniref:protein PF3D7_1417600-like isoform X2 n=1 Tax=Calliphora vicina TaxID=7373 RepID=UPI00325A80DE